MQRSTNLPVVATVARFADDLGRRFRKLIDQIFAHSVRRSAALIKAFQFNPSCQRRMDPFDKVRQDQMAMLETKGFSAGTREIFHGRKRNALAQRPLDLDLIIKVLGKDIPSERFAHCRKGQ